MSKTSSIPTMRDSVEYYKIDGKTYRKSKTELARNERRTKCAIQVMKQLTVSGYCHVRRLSRVCSVLFMPFSTKVVSPDNTVKKSLTL